jgi:preprotein translocase subunit SecG
VRGGALMSSMDILVFVFVGAFIVLSIVYNITANKSNKKDKDQK